MSESQLQALLQAIRTLQDLGKVAYFNKGVYNSETNYEINDVVSYNGSSYVSLGNNNQGNLPTNATYWSVVALKGEKGDTGKPFVIEKTYESIEDMVADYDNMQVNDYVMIQGNVEEEENATLWTKTETEAPTYKWVYLADFSGASGITGQTPNIQIGTVTEGNEPSVTRRAGSSNENPILDFVLKTGATGATGATGNGISSVSKSSTTGLTDTYTIAYTNGNSTTFDVSNGKGIVSIAKTGTSGLVDTYTITYNDGTTSTYTVTNGEDGEVTQAQLDETNENVEVLKKIYNAFPTTSDEDEEILLNETAEVQFKKFELKGNTSQETTTGKNLFDKDNANIEEGGWISINGAKGNGGDNKLFKLAIKPSTTYTIQKIFGNRFRVGTYQNDSITDGTDFNLFQQNDNGTSITITSTAIDTYLYVQYLAGDTNEQQLLDSIQIEENSSATSYEKYTGGNPSPNPDYPQEVKVVTGNNTIKVEGKNLFDKSLFETFTTSIKYIEMTLKPNTTYTMSSNIPTQSNNIDNANLFFMLDGQSASSSTNGIRPNQPRTQTTDATGKVKIGYRDFQNEYTDEANTYWYMLEQGSTATTYQAYTGTTYPVNLGNIELCKIGDYQDYIYKDNKKWYKYGAIGKVVLDGSESWQYISVTQGSLFRNNDTITNNINDNTYIPYSNNYKGIAYNNYLNRANNQFYIQNQSNFLDIIDNRYTSASDFKNWLGTHNTIVYYVLATPTSTEIQDATLIGQLNDLERAYSYEEQTNISQTNANKPFIINAEAILSLKNILNS